MCNEFVHACKSLLIDELIKAVDTDKYFLICFGNLNYFYCDDLVSIQKISNLLKLKDVVLHEIEEADLLSVIEAPYMRDNHTFHGSSVLFNQFRKKCEMP